MIDEILSSSKTVSVRQMQQCQGPVPVAFISFHAPLVKRAKQEHIVQQGAANKLKKLEPSGDMGTVKPAEDG